MGEAIIARTSGGGGADMWTTLESGNFAMVINGSSSNNFTCYVYRQDDEEFAFVFLQGGIHSETFGWYKLDWVNNVITPIDWAGHTTKVPYNCSMPTTINGKVAAYFQMQNSGTSSYYTISGPYFYPL